ncbi:hypothetical protein BCR39DRAFT_587798 [Naematelia encephala]|uniref:Uncharacterized protein n=1 Tax=Naematelia encephala TaxID=71784 RepID=A0A1Y2B6S0_9TREE|nr:hypothetical protein BCR39DRAFT_587798 [Naematelia encephala]
MRSTLLARRRLSHYVVARPVALASGEAAARYGSTSAAAALSEHDEGDIEESLEEGRLGRRRDGALTTHRASPTFSTHGLSSTSVPTRPRVQHLSLSPAQTQEAEVFKRVSTLPRDATLSASLDHLSSLTDIGCPLTPAALKILLKRTPDTASMIRLAPVLTRSLEQERDISEVVKMLNRYTKPLGQLRMIAVLPNFVDFFLRRMEECIREHQGSAEELVEWYQTFIRGLRHFADPPHIRHKGVAPSIPLPQPVRAHVARITQHLLDALDNLPSSSHSSSRPRLSDRFLSQTLCKTAFMSPKLLNLVLDHVNDRGIRMSRQSWVVCYVCAVETGSKDKIAICKNGIISNGASTARSAEPRIEAGQLSMISASLSDLESLDQQLGANAVQEEWDGSLMDLQDTRERTADNESKLKEDELHRVGRIGIEAGQAHGEADQLSVSNRNGHSPSTNYAIQTSPQSSTKLNTRVDVNHSDSAAHGPPPFAASGSVDGQDARERLTELLFARFSSETGDILEVARPLLIQSGSSRSSNDQLTTRAWSVLLSHVKERLNVDIDVLQKIQHAIPEFQLDATIAAPIMQAYVRHGHALQAMAIWRDLVERQAASPDRPGYYIDRDVLAVATEACCAASGVERAIKLVNSFAWRGGSQANALAIHLDATNVNVLLKHCQPKDRFGLAQRLWYMAGKRWGVYLDSASLLYLLEAGTGDEVVEHWRSSDTLNHWEDQLADEAFEDNVSLLDHNNEYTADQWKAKREIFHDILFQNWPSLRKIKSPLELESGRFGFLSSLFGFHSSRSSPSHSTDEPITPSSPTHQLPSTRPELPDVNSQYTHIIPDGYAFDAYLSLLAEHQQTKAIPLALGWMHHLNILPLHSTLLVALMHVTEGGGQMRHVSPWNQDGSGAFVSDEQVLMRWLEEWLGDTMESVKGRGWGRNAGKRWRKKVPTEMEVAMYTRSLLEKRQKKIAKQRRDSYAR